MQFYPRLNEKFTQDSDPISDLNIGLVAEIDKWIKTTNEYKQGYISKEKDYLWICSKHNQVDFVRYLLSKGADVHTDNDAALRSASVYGHEKVVKLLLDAGANVHANDDFALQGASTYNYDKVVKLLLDANADVHANNDAALRWASRNGHDKVVKHLLNAGADAHARDDYALRLASENGYDKVVKLLKNHITKEKKGIVKENLNEKFTQESDPVHDMDIGIMNAIKSFVAKKGFDVNDADLLWVCAEFGKTEYVKYLIEHNIGVRNDRTWHYALQYAYVNGYPEIVKMLLDAGVDIDAIKMSQLSKRWYKQRKNIKEVDKVVNDFKKKKRKEKIKKLLRLKESLNEKFTQDSDPVSDMNIGVIGVLKMEKKIIDSFKESQDKNMYLSNNRNYYGSTYCIETIINQILEKQTVATLTPKDLKSIITKEVKNRHRISLSVLGVKIVFEYFNEKCNLNLDYKKIINVNEKFTQDSDPIHDLGIGIYAKRDFKSDKEVAKFIVSVLPSILNTDEIPKDFLRGDVYFFKYEYFKPIIDYIDKYVSINNRNINSGNYSFHNIYNEIKKILLRKKRFKKTLYEKFTQDSDPVHDLGIGIYAKRNFDSIDDFVKFILYVTPFLLKTEKIPKDFLTKEMFVSDEYFPIIDNYIEKWLSFNNVSFAIVSYDMYLWNHYFALYLRKNKHILQKFL